VKLVKIRFTAWRDQPDEPRSPAFQQLLDDWTTRINLLSVAAARIKEQREHANSEALQKALGRISAELQKIDDERTPLLFAEEAVADAAARAAREHKKIGTFGYQVLNDPGTHVGYIVDEAGHYLPPKAVYSYEVVDDDPPLPSWAKKGKIGR
jgi:hypothetical protein